MWEVAGKCPKIEIVCHVSTVVYIKFPTGQYAMCQKKRERICFFQAIRPTWRMTLETSSNIIRFDTKRILFLKKIAEFSSKIIWTWWFVFDNFHIKFDVFDADWNLMWFWVDFNAINTVGLFFSKTTHGEELSNLNECVRSQNSCMNGNRELTVLDDIFGTYSCVLYKQACGYRSIVWVDCCLQSSVHTSISKLMLHQWDAMKMICTMTFSFHQYQQTHIENTLPLSYRKKS